MGKSSQWHTARECTGSSPFLIYINDLAEFCRKDSEFYLFADDAKLFKYVNVESDCEKLQSNLDDLQEWSDKWLLRLNSKKCKVISFEMI